MQCRGVTHRMGKRITQKQLDQIIREGKVKRHSCGDNLYLNITKSGTANWTIVYDIAGKRQSKGIGAYSRTSNTLGMARTKSDSYRVMIKQGSDPKVEEKKELSLKEAKSQYQENTFEKIAYDTYEQKRTGWTNQKHNKQWIKTLETYAFPVMGHLPISEVTTNHVLAVLTPIWNTKTETADRVRGRIEAVITRAEALGLREGKNPAQWRGHLSGLVTSAAKVKQALAPKEERHHPALDYRHLPAFMDALAHQGGMGARALEVCILCATRTTETLHATWGEFDLSERLWVIPARRMKGKKEHRVPLSDQALEKLNILAEVRTSEYVFPNLSNGRHLSQAGMSSVMKRMNKTNKWQDSQGRNISVHGMRSTFRDYIADKTTFDGAMAEHALAHKISDASMAAYQRSTMLEKRRGMMRVYADYAYQNKGISRNITQISA